MKKPVKKSPAKAKSWVEWRIVTRKDAVLVQVFLTEKLAKAYGRDIPCEIVKTRVTVIE